MVERAYMIASYPQWNTKTWWTRILFHEWLVMVYPCTERYGACCICISLYAILTESSRSTGEKGGASSDCGKMLMVRDVFTLLVAIGTRAWLGQHSAMPIGPQQWYMEFGLKVKKKKWWWCWWCEVKTPSVLIIILNVLGFQAHIYKLDLCYN